MDFSESSLVEHKSILLEYGFDDRFFLPLSHPSRLPIPEMEDFAASNQSPALEQDLESDEKDIKHDWHHDWHQHNLARVENYLENYHEKGYRCRASSSDKPLQGRKLYGITHNTSTARVQSRQPFFQSDKPVEITLERLAEHFHESLEVAAAKIGIGKSTMKLVCRQLGVAKWPYKFSKNLEAKALRRPGCRCATQSGHSESSDTDGSSDSVFL